MAPDGARHDFELEEDGESEVLPPGVYKSRWEVELPLTPAEEVEYAAWQKEEATRCKTRSAGLPR